MTATAYSTLDLVEIGIPPYSTDEIEVAFGRWAELGERAG